MATLPAAGERAPAYTPVIKTAEASRLIVINDNCVLTLDAVLSVTGIGKVLSHRGHELYTLYNAAGGTLCQFEGTGLMQRTVTQIDQITRENAARLEKLKQLPKDAGPRLEAVERQIDAIWYMPGCPGARQAEDDFLVRNTSISTTGKNEINDDGDMDNPSGTEIDSSQGAV